MPLYSPTQSSGPQTKMPNGTGSEAQKAMLPPEIAVAVRYRVAGWQVNLHDGNGWQNLVNQAEYIPPFYVTRILINDATNANRAIYVCLSGNGETCSDGNDRLYQEGVELNLLTNCMHDLHVTKLFLGAVTNAQEIVFLS